MTEFEEWCARKKLALMLATLFKDAPAIEHFEDELRAAGVDQTLQGPQE